jgi:RNA polymerase sigma-70 factor (ECF subfamily)
MEIRVLNFSIFYGHKFTYLLEKIFYSFTIAKTVTTENAALTAEQFSCSHAEDILNNYGKSILRLAYSYLHNMSDAEDILQDTLIRFLTSSPVFENENHKKAWLMRVAANLSKNRIKYNKIRSTDELNETLTAENKEDLSFVWTAVKTLSPKYSEVIHLFYYEGYSTKEIADILNKKESTVRSDLNRARQKLKSVLKEAYDFE